MALRGNGRKTTRLRQQALSALLTQPTIEAASRVSGVSQTTLNRWLQDERFASELAEARNQVLTAAIDRLKAASYDSVVFLQAVVNSPNAIESNRVNAAKFLVELALRVGAMEQLEQRICELERGVDGAEEFATESGTIIEGGKEQQERNYGDSEEWSAGDSWAIGISTDMH